MTGRDDCTITSTPQIVRYLNTGIMNLYGRLSAQIRAPILNPGMSVRGLFDKNGTVPLSDRFYCENGLLHLKQKEKGHLYGERNGTVISKQALRYYLGALVAKEPFSLEWQEGKSTNHYHSISHYRYKRAQGAGIKSSHTKVA